MALSVAQRIESFEHEGKPVLYFNLSDIGDNQTLEAVIRQAMAAMAERDGRPVYTLTDITRIVFDTRTKELAAEWMTFNRPFVRGAAFVGAAGARKIMINAVFALSGRSNARLFHDKDQALKWIATL